VPMSYIIEGEGALVNAAGEEQFIKSGNFACSVRTKSTSTGTCRPTNHSG
jgi:hypothetical protein